MQSSMSKPSTCGAFSVSRFPVYLGVLRIAEFTTSSLSLLASLCNASILSDKNR